MGQRLDEGLARQRDQVRARLAELDSARKHVSDPELFAHELVEPDPAGREVSPALAGASSIPERARASTSSASINVTSLPSPLSILAPSRRALRSPVSPT